MKSIKKYYEKYEWGEPEFNHLNFPAISSPEKG